ncbi:MAG UNVERIFIED_CONTAM: hypothetical protein LVR18_32010 [Planctomycetaceae bacterium]
MEPRTRFLIMFILCICSSSSARPQDAPAATSIPESSRADVLLAGGQIHVGDGSCAFHGFCRHSQRSPGGDCRGCRERR